MWYLAKFFGSIVTAAMLGMVAAFSLSMVAFLGYIAWEALTKWNG